ncbi:unnamed protein product, partial [Linum tenue]
VASSSQKAGNCIEARIQPTKAGSTSPSQRGSTQAGSKVGPPLYTFSPFGGGPRMCTGSGKEYARLEILVFMCHLVKRFRFQKLIPDENIVVDPMPIPAKGLPVRLFPHKR